MQDSIWHPNRLGSVYSKGCAAVSPRPWHSLDLLDATPSRNCQTEKGIGGPLYLKLHEARASASKVPDMHWFRDASGAPMRTQGFRNQRTTANKSLPLWPTRGVYATHPCLQLCLGSAIPEGPYSCNTGVSLTEKPGTPPGYLGLPYPRSSAPEEEPPGNRQEEEAGTAPWEVGRTGSYPRAASPSWAAQCSGPGDLEQLPPITHEDMEGEWVGAMMETRMGVGMAWKVLKPKHLGPGGCWRAPPPPPRAQVSSRRWCPAYSGLDVPSPKQSAGLSQGGHTHPRADHTLFWSRPHPSSEQATPPPRIVRVQWKKWLTLFFWAPKSLQMVIAAMKLKDT